MDLSRVIVNLASVPRSQPIYTFNPLEDARWNSLVQNHPRASVFHSSAWLQALRRAYGYDPVAFTTCPPDSELQEAAVFCQVNSWLTGNRLVSVPFADHCDVLIDREPNRGAVFNALLEGLGHQNLRYVEIRPTGPLGSIESKLKRTKSYCLHRIDLDQSIGDLFKQLHKNSTQRKIQRAKRDGITYQEGRIESLLDAFQYLSLLTRRRHSAPPQPIRWFRHLIECFGDSLKIRAAFKDQRPIAAILTLQHKDALVYKYGCSDAGFHCYGGMHLLLWRSIVEAKRDGLRTFDLGRTELSNEGLITFKNRWGAARTELHYSRLPGISGVAPEPSETKAYWIRLLRGISTYLPDSAFRAVGSMMYPHLG